MVKISNSNPKTLAQSIGYWRQKLANSEPLLDLPTDKPRQSSTTYRTETQSIFLAQKLIDSLTIIARDRDVDLFVTLLAVFKVLIYRYVDRQDISIGLPISREPGSTGDLLVLRTDLSGNPTFTQVLDRTRQVVVEADEHQDLSFDRLIEALEIELSPSYHPIVQVMFSWADRNADVQSGLAEKFKITRTYSPPDRRVSAPDLSLHLEQTQTGISGYFEYSTDLFNPETIDRMAMHFQVSIESIIANPEQSIDEITILSDSERHQLLVDWNQTQIDYPHQCIHQLFEAQVERTPDNIAVVFEQQQLTYRELNDRANQLAHYLRARGVGKDVLVGLYVERSLAMVVGLWGILKAGGAYVPLDPAYQ